MKLYGGIYDGWAGDFIDTGEDVTWLGPPGEASYAYRRGKPEGKLERWYYDQRLSDARQKADNPNFLHLPPDASGEKKTENTKLTIRRNENERRWEMLLGSEIIATRQQDIHSKEEAQEWLRDVTGLEEKDDNQ